MVQNDFQQARDFWDYASKVW